MTISDVSRLQPRVHADEGAGEVQSAAGGLDAYRIRVGLGELRVFDASSDVPLERAVAASCCVPGIFAPVSIGGRRYVDGGVRSGTSADLARERGARHVVVLAPMVRGNAGLARLMFQLLDAEIALLREAGAEVALVTPSREDARVLGLDFMDPKTRADAVRLGLEAGRREASLPELAAWRG